MLSFLLDLTGFPNQFQILSRQIMTVMLLDDAVEPSAEKGCTPEKGLRQQECLERLWLCRLIKYDDPVVSDRAKPNQINRVPQREKLSCFFVFHEPEPHEESSGFDANQHSENHN